MIEILYYSYPLNQEYNVCMHIILNDNKLAPLLRALEGVLVRISCSGFVETVLQRRNISSLLTFLVLKTTSCAIVSFTLE